MGKVGIANLPLHGGKAPKWLFKRMVLLSRGIVDVILFEYGKDEFIRRLSDPFWFQAFSCVLGYDWHSSGTTTVTCGALRKSIDPYEHGFAIAGGKGKASQKTLQQLEDIGTIFNYPSKKIEEFQYNSMMTAKIDNSAIQDGHNLYHHVFLLSETGLWGVIQQGMNSETNYARRYHWLSENIENFIDEPHKAILGEVSYETVLDMTSKNSKSTQEISVDLVKDHPRHLHNDWAELNRDANQKTLENWTQPNKDIKPVEHLNMPRSINWAKIKEIYDFQPKNYEQLLSIKGVGPNTIRALALISDLIYGEKPSWKDPIKFSFAVGGKDGVPYPVDKKAMDESTIIIKQGIEQAKIGNNEKIRAFKRLHNFFKCN